jgi:hypothetical protein
MSVSVICKSCNSTFSVPMHRSGTATFCSKQCQNHTQYLNRVKFTCRGCAKLVEASPSRTDKKYCSIECRSNSARTESVRRQLRKQRRYRNSNRSRNLRKWIWEHKAKKCEICSADYSAHDYCLDLHHIDNNCDNNTPENIAVLCAPCHRKLHKGHVQLCLILAS